MNISDNIVYVGVDDKDIGLFEHQYPVDEGISYNSYVILDDKIAIMDTADERRQEEWLGKVEAVLDGKAPAYLIVQHLEPDHSGGIQALVAKYPDMQVVGSAKTSQMIAQFIDDDISGRFLAIKEGDTLELGSHTLHFVMAPMVHWPEVMVSYESSEKVLFSADGFGTFGAIENKVPWIDEATHYYFNIVGKYGSSVQALLKKAAGLDIARIAPLHGPVLPEEGKDLSYYIQKYDTWSKYEPETKGILLCVSSLHRHTIAAVEQFADELRAAGEEEVEVIDLNTEDVSEAVEKCFMYDRIVLASVTYDGSLFPTMQDLLYHLSIKNFRNRTFGLIENGSWAPIAAKKMREFIEGFANCTILEPVVSIRTRRTAADDSQFAELAKALVG
ncbi:MAG: FprA family A-type flavoprotein [Lachnospiraceae bacterium]|nr:FprA family A-type flavoprotein [Lachnospiraceae bacterium]